MSDDLIGVRACGCITAMLVVRYSTKTDIRDFYREMADSGREVRRASIDSLRDDPNFMPVKCPHRKRAAKREPQPTESAIKKAPNAQDSGGEGQG